MLRYKGLIILWAVCALMPVTLFAFNDLPDTIEARELIVSGTASLTEGQLVAGHHKKTFEYRPWIQLAIAQIRLDAFIGNRLHVIVAPEVKLWYDTYPITDVPDRSGTPFRQRSTVAIANGQGIVDIGDPDDPFMQFAAGVIHYKYNNDARNLGEYLFRTGVHPAYIFTEFDYAFSRVHGLRLSSQLLEKKLSIDLFLSFEPEIHPLHDASITIQAGYNMPSLFDVGAGIQFNRCFPVSGKLITSPDDQGNSYTTSTGETEYYHFGGTKLMARGAFDFKGLLPETVKNRFGKEDGKVYAEIAVLGVKNYKNYIPMPNGLGFMLDTLETYYDDISKRIPIMLGINIPTMKLLDVLSLEMEWYGWPYTNSYFDQGFDYENPVPKGPQNYMMADYTKDNWKFSLYAKRSVLKGFTIIGQIARDHSHVYFFPESQRDEEEALTLPDKIESIGDVFTPVKWGEFGWWLKLQYEF